MKRSNHLFADGFRIAMAYIGTVVGAGFATGQEIMQFFTRYGFRSFWAILISAVLFILVGRSILLYGRKLDAKSYGSLADHIFGWTGSFINLYLGVTFVLICGAMFAGAGALFQEQWGVPYIIGASVTAFLTLLVTLRGIKGVLTVNSFIVPLLVVFSVLVFAHVVLQGYKPAVSMHALPLSLEIFNLLRTGVTYASFNLVLSIGVLAPMGREPKSEKALYLGSFLGGTVLGLLLAMGNYSLLCFIPEVFNREIPQMAIVGRMGSFFVTVYGLVVWAEIFTTAVGNLFAIHTIVQERYMRSSPFPAIAAAAAGLIICGLGFSNIVSWFYSALGIIGFALSAVLLVQIIRSRR
ncbi:MAG TPA: hypothetical protein GX505_10815 [Clostridiales bacterium]|nr:hypothetical protein [Clostridiales bacterium]